MALVATTNAAAYVQLVPTPVSVDGQIASMGYDLSVGFLVSYVTYLLVVYIPERRKRRAVSRHLQEVLRRFKVACIQIYLLALGESYESGLPEELLDPQRFREYFTGRYGSDRTYWDQVHNGLYDWGVPELAAEADLLAREVDAALTVLGDVDEELLTYLRGLTRILRRLKLKDTSYDGIKQLLSTLYPIHANWDWVEGYTDTDPITQKIADLGK